MLNIDLLKCNRRSGYLYRILFIILVPMAQCIYFFLNLTTTGAYDITIFLDKFIPFNEWFIVPYVFWYLYTFGALLVLAYFDSKTYFKLLFSILIGMLICFVVYYLFPTTVPRTEVILPNNILKKAVLMIYQNDRPYNCFPSIHMLDTLLITMFLIKYNKSLIIKISSAFICVAIYMSTLFIKQHSILDAVASTILGVILFFVFENEFVSKKLVSARDFFIHQKPKSSLS
ncbi:MAG: phosphatase PAP2 family protein [Ruminiclostridium sp.]